MGLPSPLTAAMSAMVLSVETTAYALRRLAAVVAAARREECRKSRRFMGTSLFGRTLSFLQARCESGVVPRCQVRLPADVGGGNAVWRRAVLCGLICFVDHGEVMSRFGVLSIALLALSLTAHSQESLSTRSRLLVHTDIEAD